MDELPFHAAPARNTIYHSGFLGTFQATAQNTITRVEKCLPTKALPNKKEARLSPGLKARRPPAAATGREDAYLMLPEPNSG